MKINLFTLVCMVLLFSIQGFNINLIAVNPSKLLSGKDSIRVCGSNEAWQKQRQKNPDFNKRMKAFDQRIREYLQTNSLAKTQTVITVPVVFHVMYNTQSENLSDVCIQSCLAALNRDFRKKNTDISTAPSQFQAIAADCEFNFCLANKDPQGNPTNGIIHKQTTVTKFTMNDEIKFSAQGGDDTWGAKNYLNIWVGNLGTNLGGYANYPATEPDSIDGVVINYDAAGQGSCALYNAYKKGRSLVHEVGHWLGLYHNFEGGCDGLNSFDCSLYGDQVCDTPPSASSGASNYCTQKNTCTEIDSYPPPPYTGDQVDMIQNYMDYTDDYCRVLFTEGQKARMIAAVNLSRQGILTSANTNCNITGISNTEAVTFTGTIYPNPSINGEFTIQIPNQTRAEMMVYNMLGQPVQKAKLKGGTNNINLSSTPNGIYCIIISNGKDVIVKKIIIE